MKKYLLFLLLFIYSPFIYPQTDSSEFYFFAFGDMPYFYPEDYDRFENVINQLNQQDPSFSVHIGDIKTSGTPCSDEHFERIKTYFNKFNHPLVYTPGDNEWTDCHKEEAGSYEPEERLEKLREIYFGDRLTFGAGELPVVSQRENEDFKAIPENLIWEVNYVTFGTVHVVGSNNNFSDEEEYLSRDKANVFWIEKLFQKARADNSQGLVIFMHASLRFYQQKLFRGFNNTVNTLKDQLSTYDKPVLLVYGDDHRFMIDKPLRKKDRSLFTNFTAVQVFGSSDMHAVRITVDPKSKNLFQVDQEIIMGN